MSDSRQAKVRRWSLGIAALGMALWIASFAIPHLFGEERGWTEDDSKAYAAAGARLHDLLEGAHDHDEQPVFENEEAEKAFAEAQRRRPRMHVQVDPRDVAQAKEVFLDQQNRLEAARSGNARQIGVLFWGGIVLMIVGATGFFAANHAD